MATKFSSGHFAGSGLGDGASGGHSQSSFLPAHPSVGNNHLPTDDSQLRHIFGVREGHLADTPRNRQTLLELANDAGSFDGTDAHGLDWFTRIAGNGAQYWVSVRNNVIQEGGYNRTPREWDDQSGYNRNPYKKGKKK